MSSSLFENGIQSYSVEVFTKQLSNPKVVDNFTVSKLSWIFIVKIKP